MFKEVFVRLLIWFFLHFCGMLKVLVQLYFQVHYYDVSTVVWKSHKKSHFTIFASEASLRFEFQLQFCQVLARKFIFKWDIFWSFSNHCTVFENHPKWRISVFQFWHFPSIFVLLKLTCLVTLFDRKLQVFKKSPKWIIFGISSKLLSTQNVNVARFARNVEWDFFCDFQTPCVFGFSRMLSTNKSLDVQPQSSNLVSRLVTLNRVSTTWGSSVGVRSNSYLFQFPFPRGIMQMTFSSVASRRSNFSLQRRLNVHLRS